jgi:hypothetical protein
MSINRFLIVWTSPQSSKMHVLFNENVFVINWLKSHYKLQHLFCGTLNNPWKCKKLAVPLRNAALLLCWVSVFGVSLFWDTLCWVTFFWVWECWLSQCWMFQWIRLRSVLQCYYVKCIMLSANKVNVKAPHWGHSLSFLLVNELNLINYTQTGLISLLYWIHCLKIPFKGAFQEIFLKNSFELINMFTASYKYFAVS